MLILALGSTILARLTAVASLCRGRQSAQYPWLCVFLLLGCVRSGGLLWAVWRKCGYADWYLRTAGLMQLLLFAVVLESAWKLAKGLEERET